MTRAEIYFSEELLELTKPNYKQYAIDMINNLPSYFFEVGASSTGKYHPKFAQGKGGLVRHTRAAVRIAKHLFTLSMFNFNENEKQLLYIALMLHDGWKCGKDGGKFTVHEHPLISAQWVLNTKDNLISDVERQYIASAIVSHMGQWNTSKYSDIVLPLPQTPAQCFVMMCDYLASRRDIEIDFELSSL